jgi:hypothetical protein
MDSLSVIFPVYDLGGDRLNNFCYVLRQLCDLSLCDIIVAEQLSQNTNIQTVLQRHTNVRYIPVPIEGHTFNKSKIINQATSHTTADYIWIIDSDFYTDFGFVIASITNEQDFIRPFNRVVMLSADETDTLQETDNVLINREQYETNSADGKYSFIVKRSVFIESGMMNEDFHGWGFQDLDFVNNRLVNCSKTYVDTFGFHMYHSPASRKYVNRNKRLYMNLSSEDNPPKYENEMQTTDVCIHKTPTETTENIELDIKLTNEQTKNISEPNPVNAHKVTNTTHVYHMTKKIPAFPDKMCSHILKTKAHYLSAYIGYIIDNYDKLDGGYVFSSDLLSDTPKVYGEFTSNRISDILESGSSSFRWVSVQTRLRLKSGHTTTPVQSEYEYDYWVELYTGLGAKHLPKYSLAGVFYVNATDIKKYPVEFYIRISDRMCIWVDEDYVFFLATLENIFT